MDDDEHEKQLQRALAELKRQTDESIAQMSSTMMEAMAPVLMGTQLLGDEAKAWDSYLVAFVRSNSNANGDEALAFADGVLAERKKRFNESALKERMRGMLPSGQGLCNEPVLRLDGTDTGMRCTRNAGHDGRTHF